MRKDMAILLIVMVGIMCFIVGYSISPDRIKTCPHVCDKKADVKAEMPVDTTPKSHEEKPAKAAEQVKKPTYAIEKKKEVEEPTPEKLDKETPETPEKQPAKTDEETGGYGY